MSGRNEVQEYHSSKCTVLKFYLTEFLIHLEFKKSKLYVEYQKLLLELLLSDWRTHGNKLSVCYRLGNIAVGYISCFEQIQYSSWRHLEKTWWVGIPKSQLSNKNSDEKYKFISNVKNKLI